MPVAAGQPVNHESLSVAFPAAFSEMLQTKQLSDLGAAPASQDVHLVITLAHRDEAGLRQLIAEQRTPGSGEYERFLTPQQFDQRFGASPETRLRVVNALRAAGFDVLAQRLGASVIEADAPAARAEAYFATRLHDVREVTGRVAMIPASPVQVPRALQQGVISIVGLDTTSIQLPHRAPPRIGNPSRPMVVMPCHPGMPCIPIPCGITCPHPTPPVPQPTPAPTAPPGSQFPQYGPDQPVRPPAGYTDDATYNYSRGYAPYTYAQDYDMPVQHGFGGSAAYPIGFLIPGDVLDSDLQSFYQDMGVDRTGSLIRIDTPGHTVRIGGSDDQFEATLDAETLSALAPAATIYQYRPPSFSPADIVSAMNVVDQDNSVAVLSMSFGGCEKWGWSYPGFWPIDYGGTAAMGSAAEQGSAQGITFVASSGDAGGPPSLSGCTSVWAPASSADVVAVGGTSPFAPDNNMGAPGAYGYRYQYAWGQYVPNPGKPCAQNFCGTGGGASTYFKTDEQLNACGGTWRCVPDISLAADYYHRGFMVLNGAAIAGANGTSFAAPIFAAIQAEIDQRQNTRKGNVVGRLYSLWRTYGYRAFASGQPAIFTDITAGNTGYAASPGYDWASGIGTINGWALSSVE